MLVHRLNVTVAEGSQEEKNLKEMGAFYHKPSKSWYFSEYHPEPGLFSAWQVTETLPWQNPSITMLCKMVHVDISGARRLMEETKMLVPGTTDPTQEAMNLGVTITHGTRNGKDFSYAVYPDNFAKFFADNRQRIGAYAEEEKKKKDKEKSVLNRAQARTDFGFPVSKFKKLEIPDNALIIDTETTGLGDQDEIVELSIVDIFGNVLYDQRFHPSVPMNPEASAINHITDDMLKDQPWFAHELSKIYQILYGKPLIGHNISFDVRLLKQTAKKYFGPDADANISNMIPYVIDSKEIAKEFFKTKRVSLDILCRMLGKDGEEEHKASEDCKWLLWLLEALENRPFESMN